MQTSAPIQTDPLYARARQLLLQQPDMGKAKLAAALGVKTPTSRRLRERFRGETLGHNTGNPDYCRVQQLKVQHPDWGAVKVAAALGLTIDHAKVHLARWIGAQSFNATATPSAPTQPVEAPAPGAELQISGSDASQNVSYRGSRIRTIEDLLAFSQTDTAVWEVERHVINKWEVGARDPASGTILTEPLFQNFSISAFFSDIPLLDFLARPGCFAQEREAGLHCWIKLKTTHWDPARHLVPAMSLHQLIQDALQRDAVQRITWMGRRRHTQFQHSRAIPSSIFRLERFSFSPSTSLDQSSAFLSSAYELPSSDFGFLWP